MAIRKTMNVSLAPELERFVEETVASGRYRSANEVVLAVLTSEEGGNGAASPGLLQSEARRS
jgi:putative addiction module CopG family antidote